MEKIGMQSTTIMSLSVAYTASIQANGYVTDQEEISKMKAMIRDILKLSDHKIEMLLYLEKTVKSVAPNVCEIIGPKVAAKLVSTAGGITELSRIPASNIQVLG